MKPLISSSGDSVGGCTTTTIIILHYLWLLQLLPPPLVSFAQVFRDSPANVEALTNFPITLSCSAPDPAPPASILWLHNDIAATSNDRISIVYDSSTGRSEFKISSVNYFDDGTYQCFAENDQGEIVSSSEIGNLTAIGEFNARFQPPCAGAWD